MPPSSMQLNIYIYIVSIYTVRLVADLLEHILASSSIDSLRSMGEQQLDKMVNEV